MTSLNAELFPSSAQLEEPEAALKRLLAGSTTLTADSKRSAAEEGLAATKASITAMTTGGVDEKDEILEASVRMEECSGH